MPFRFILCLYFFCTSISAFTQTNNQQYKFRRLDISKGLTNNEATCILKDSKGFMWFGTMSGLNRFDGYKFKNFKHSNKDSTSIDDDFISNIFEMPEGKLLIYTRNWVNVYDPVTEKFEHAIIPYLNTMALPNSNFINAFTKANGNFYFLIAQQGLYKYLASTKKSVKINLSKKAFAVSMAENIDGNYWFVYGDGTMQLLDTKTDKVIFETDILKKQTDNSAVNYKIFVDKQNEVWVYASGDSKGVFYYNSTNNKLLSINTNSGKTKLNTDLVRAILQDNQSDIWICTDHGGINIFNKKDGTIQYVLNNKDDNNSLSQNSITTTYKDNAGIIWIGTYKKGFNSYHENIIKIPLYKNHPSSATSLSYDDVNRFVEDAKGNIWIGTNGGGIIYFDRAKDIFTQYKHQPGNSNSLSNDVVVGLYVDKQQKLWIGTYFGGLDCYDGKTFIHYQHSAANNKSIADNRIWDIYEDVIGNLWIGTLGGGLDKFDRKTNTFYHYKAALPNSINSDFISVIKEALNGDLWVGTANGIDVIDKTTSKIIHYGTDAKNAKTLSNGNVQSIYTDAKKRVWVGTREGLNIFNTATKTFQRFTIEDGLPDNSVLTILEDKNGIWVSTPNGISNITVANEQKDNVTINCKNYDESDGLQSNQFNQNAALRTSKGELIFGGPNGFNLFLPQNIIADKQVPQLVFTDFQLFNKSISPAEEINGTVLLENSITQTKDITLKYNQNVIAIEFAALNYSSADKNKYAYKLEGFKNEWLVTDEKNRKAVFTNLDPGNYTFYVKTANNTGQWNDNAIQLHIKILPPFWKSAWAYISYFLIILIALYVSRRMIIQKARAKFAIEQERLEAQRMHDLDLMKIKFFTNVSHEFRTPLSLILAPIDKMLKQTVDAGQKQQYQLIHRNARRLLNLVNQLLDFRKMEEKELKLQKTRGDIVQYISDVSYSFSDVADKKNISFSFHANIDSLETDFDQDKIERILFNLLSNAFKFTPENGHVGVAVTIKAIDVDQPNLYQMEIAVNDTGIGIEADKQEKIFERFFQNDMPGSIVNQGSGIGLAITKEFVKLHGGNISVESEPNKGSCFIVSLPLLAASVTANNTITKQAIETNTTAVEDTDLLDEETHIEPPLQKNSKSNNKKATVLLVEDNEDFRFYLKDNLKEFFNILEANNGKLGWQKALAAHPDLIVSDISMPEMTGIELCKKIKTDTRTNHIPIILLTALTGEEQQLKGLETGANDYMTKPFNFEILLSKIKNQLTQQEQVKKTYQKQVSVKATDVVVASPNEKFMQQVLQLIEKNISEPDFSVEEMSKGMFMSRVALYKRLLALTGKTPIEFIRQIRLKRAAQLLEKSDMTIAEVAYEVGFNNPKNFSKYFKAEFDKLPSIYMEEMRKANANGKIEE